MAYIGVQPTDTYLSIASQQITGTGSATYTLDYSVSTEEDVAVFVNNVRQNVSSYTVSGTSLTLGGTISASDSCWVLFLGRTVGTKTPANNSVTGDMLSKPFTYDDASDGSVTGISVNNDYPTTSTASAGTGSGIRFGVNDGSFTSAFGDARGSEILSVTQQSNGRTRDIVFKTDNGGTLGEKMRILASGGITFNGDTASANALDDYEEGTWTPTFGGTITDPTVSLDIQVASYRKIGNQVTVSMYIRGQCTSQGSGSLLIEGLPFTINSSSNNYQSGIVAYAQNFGSDNAPRSITAQPSSTVVRCRKNNSSDPRTGMVSADAGSLGTGAANNTFMAQITYFTD